MTLKIYFTYLDYVRQLEDEFVEDDDLDIEFHRDTHLIMSNPQRKRHSLHHVIEYCLVAILSHSTIKSHCQILLQNTMEEMILEDESENQNDELELLAESLVEEIELIPEETERNFTTKQSQITDFFAK